jgi:hypothetical protein
MLILGFALPWTTVDLFGVSESGDGPFDYFFTGGIAWILIVGVGVLALLNALGRLPHEQPWTLIFLGASGVATLLMVLRILMGARFDVADRGTGMYGALIWSGVTLAGAVVAFQASGGDLKDLTDVDKLKASFSQGGGDDTGGTPPPPPAPPSGGSTPPPPPPPPPSSPGG